MESKWLTLGYDGRFCAGELFMDVGRRLQRGIFWRGVEMSTKLSMGMKTRRALAVGAYLQYDYVYVWKTRYIVVW